MTPHESPSLALGEPQGRAGRVALGTRAVLLRGFAREPASELIAAIDAIAAISPFRHMVTPGGWEMSVALTNCGQVGWVTDRSGYVGTSARRSALTAVVRADANWRPARAAAPRS